MKRVAQLFFILTVFYQGAAYTATAKHICITSYICNSPLTDKQCDNSANQMILQSNVSGTTFVWTATPPPANLSTGYGPESGIINAYPTPDLSNNPLIQSQCNYMATNLSLTSDLSGTTFTRNCIPSSANMTGYITGSGNETKNAPIV